MMFKPFQSVSGLFHWYQFKRDVNKLQQPLKPTPRWTLEHFVDVDDDAIASD
jgi:hypothetical protein